MGAKQKKVLVVDRPKESLISHTNAVVNTHNVEMEKNLDPNLHSSIYPYVALDNLNDFMPEIPVYYVNNNKPVSKYARLATEEELSQFKVGRNEPCPCNSGRKFKHCCLK